jgi:hypothetical protein
MRRKTLVEGFKNSQKFRFILRAAGGEEFGMYITVQQMSEQFATGNARAAVWDAMIHLSYDRRVAEAACKPVPTGLVRSCYGYQQVQVDLV